MLFQDVFKEFIERKKFKIKQSTIDLYERLYQQHFLFFKDMEIEKFTTSTVDNWISYLHCKNKNKQRMSFDHELTLLKTIVNYYWDQHDVKLDIFKKRHTENIIVKVKSKKISKELTEEEFKLFLHWLSILYGERYTMLAVIQYYQALRISEAIAVHYNDFKLDYQNPFNSSLTIQRSVVFSHRTDKKSYLQDGFKNGDIKIQPVIPQVYFYLKDRLNKYTDQYLFINDNIPEFYKIKNAYTKAFKRAGLPYSSTHILRHGGCSRLFNISGGNIIIASQILGNSQEETIRTYAHGYNNSLKNFTNGLWDNLGKA